MVPCVSTATGKSSNLGYLIAGNQNPFFFEGSIQSAWHLESNKNKHVVYLYTPIHTYYIYIYIYIYITVSYIMPMFAAFYARQWAHHGPKNSYGGGWIDVRNMELHPLVAGTWHFAETP